MHINNYYDHDGISTHIDADHREVVGGLWEEIGRLQLDFLVSRGLRPEMRLLDIGCGCLRGGVQFVRYLQPDRYFGTDLLEPLLSRGYDTELASAGLQHKLPRTNLLCDAEFSFDAFNVQFDMAIAQSVFTHLPLNHLRLCLIKLAPVMSRGGLFYATIFRSESPEHWAKPIVHPHGTRTYPHRDPYHYCYSDAASCVENLPWKFAAIGGWNHPYDQVMISFRRV